MLCGDIGLAGFKKSGFPRHTKLLAYINLFKRRVFCQLSGSVSAMALVAFT